MEKRLSRISFNRGLWCLMASSCLLAANTEQFATYIPLILPLKDPVTFHQRTDITIGHCHTMNMFWATIKESVQFSHSIVSGSFVTPWTAACQASLSITNSQSSLKLMSIESVMLSNHLILYCTFSPHLQSFWVFSNESVLCIRWPKHRSLSFRISPSNKYSGLISFRKDWLDLLAVQGTLKSLLQHHSSKASPLQCSAFFIVLFLSLIVSTHSSQTMINISQTH